MAWIESHQQLLNHPKTLDLMNLMRWNNDTAIGKLHRFWWWCMDYAPDGDLRRHSASQVAAAVGVSKSQAEKFVSAMIHARWLDTTPYFRVHDWWQYAGPFLQRKHSRNPHVWRQVRDSYVTPCATSTVELDESCSAPVVQQEECSIPPTVQLVSCSSTPPNLTLPDQTIPNPTIPDLTKQKKQHQQQNSAADAADHDYEHPGRHQQQSPQTQALITGAAADAVGPGDFAYTPPLHAGPGNDLERIIYDRIGDNTPLSRLDLEKLIALKNKHGPKFYIACDRLHGSVTNPAAYLHAILEPKDATEALAAQACNARTPSRRDDFVPLICEQCGGSSVVRRSQLEQDAQAGRIYRCINYNHCPVTFSARTILEQEFS